jgi:8-oxo-dGTP pyrophosphatase MutT (NUDIX family)
MVYVRTMDLEQYLRGRLREPLPGAEAHRLMIPDAPDMRLRLEPPPPTARRSAVLVPLVTRGHAFPDVLFTLRSDGLRSHGGQISFPGGRLDDGEDVEQAALREMFEETGVDADDVVVLGRMTELYIPPSNSAVTPVVGMIREPHAYAPSEQEVSEIFTVPLLAFLDQASVQYLDLELVGRSVQWPMWSVHHTVPLWGATAMILSELAWLVNEHLHS